MNRRKGLILIAASTVAGVVCSAGIYSAVAANRDDSDDKAGTKLSATLPTVTKTSKAPKKQAKAAPRTTVRTVAPPKSAFLSVDNLLLTSSLTSLGYPVDTASATRADGDNQYIATPCIQKSVGAVTGGNVFAGSWPMTDGGIVSEVISVAVADEPAAAQAEEIVGWHQGQCGGWVVGPHHRAAIAGGFTDWVELTGTGEQEGSVDHAAVIKVNSRVGVLGVETSGHSEPAFLALMNRAVAALR